MHAKPIRLGIVDDHKLIRETWKMILQTYPDIEVVLECGDGESACREAPTAKPHVMLIDVNMSPMNGFETAQALLELLPEISIIAISVNDQPSYAKHILHIGGKGYVTKNSSHPEMVAAIREVAQNRIYICREVREKMPVSE